MSQSISASTKKRGRPKTTGKGVQVGVRLLPHLLDPLDAWIAAQPEPQPTRPEAIRTALEGWLAERRPLPPAELDETIEALDTKAASLKVDGAPSPRRALNQMKKARAENEKTKLENKRAKAKRKEKP